MQEPKPLNVLLYSDYRTFLKDYYQTHKAADGHFSFRYLSLRAGINSSAFYKYVIDGKRNLTKSTLLKTCAALKLRDQDAEYFENLVFFNQAKSLREKNLYFAKLTQLRGDYDQRRIQEDQYAFYGDWRHSAVRELVSCLRHRKDFQTLANLLIPTATPDQAETSVELLARLGLIKKDARGRWKQTDSVVTTGGQVEAPIVIALQKQMLHLALEAFDRSQPSERLMSSTTFGISAESFELFRKKIREWKAELLELARRDANPSRVYQLNLNFFPLSREVGK
jgi:uncharacterized protein (TIGR02147 family)